MKTLARQLIFDNEADARAACALYNAQGGFYQVRDLVKDPHPAYAGDTGFIILWDAQASDQWRFGNLPKHFQRRGHVHQFHQVT